MTKGILNLKIPYEPREWQLEASKILTRFTVLVMHRRAGKTVFDVNSLWINVLKTLTDAIAVFDTFSAASHIQRI